MAAHEKQQEGVVLIRLGAELWRDLQIGVQGDDGFAAPAGGLAAHVIGHRPRRDSNQPAARVVGHAVPRPLAGGGDQRLLHGVLGGSEVPVPPDDRTEHLRRKLAQQMLGTGVQRWWRHRNSLGGPLITWRTSIAMLSGSPPGPGAAEASAAIW